MFFLVCKRRLSILAWKKNSFLYVEDVLTSGAAYSENKPQEGKPHRSINELVRKGQQVTVQIFKEPSGTKGARVTMYPSLPGRYLVLLRVEIILR